MSVLDVKVKSGESPKFYKSGISSLEKRINQLEHQVFCCIPAELAEEHSHSQVILFALTANDAGTGTWQTITPATGIAVIPAPGAGKVTVIDRVVLELTCTVDITATSTIDPSITLYQTGGGTAVTDIIDLSGVTAAVTNEIAVAAPTRWSSFS